MHFLFISSRYDDGIGGHAAMLANQLQKAGHKVDLLKAPHIGIKNLKNPSFAILATLKTLTSRKQYDIVHAFNLPSALAMKYARTTAKVLSLHGVYSEQIGMIHSKSTERLATFAESRVLKWADVLTTDSRRTADEYHALGYDLKHMPSAIDTSAFDVITHVKKHSNRQVAYVGRDSYEKGTDILRRIEPDINGDVKYCTNVAWKDAMSVLAASSVLVLPSRIESLPTVVKEAFYLRVPVVAMSVGGVPELVEDGKTGFLTKLGDESRMTSIINGILDGSIPTSKIVQAAYKYVTENMTWNTITAQYVNMYKELLASHNSRTDKF